jgi:dsRNA-specific ribonuclease
MDVTVTPASVLQAICITLDQPPDFQLLSAEGVVHAPTFIYRVTVGDLQAQGSGNSKKKAKHSAALCMLKLLLLKMDNDDLPEVFNPETVSCLKSYSPVIGYGN